MTSRAARRAPAAALLALLASGPSAARAAGFHFTVERAGPTSAGVFAADGTLLRTLWSGVPFAPGRHEADWDGRDDAGATMRDGRYEVRVVTSRASYTWEGVLGNTSDAWTGPGVFHFMTTIGGMAVAGRTAFVAAGYNEGDTSQARFSIDHSGVKTAILAKGAEFMKVATDGARVYWAGDDPNVVDDGFVVATRVADDGEVAFEQGRRLPTKYGMAYARAIDVVAHAGAEPTGIAVQARGRFLFVARRGMNSVHVLDKLTGRLVRSLAFDSPGDLAVDAADALWVIRGASGARTVQRLDVRPDGSLAPGVALTGLEAPLALGAGRAVLVADGGSRQQVRAFDLAGRPLWTLGQPGGYAAEPRVADDRFDLEPGLEYTGTTFVALQDDGSFWLGDTGCYRLLRFSAARALVDRVSYLPTFYSAGVDANDPTRVFANDLELAVDYSRPLGPRNGSWRLVRNWRPGVPKALDYQTGRMKYVTTLANRRTYAAFGREVFELPASGPVRRTGVSLPGASLYADGAVRGVQESAGVETWTEWRLEGFDGDDNPRWGPARVLARAPLDALAPHDVADEAVLRAGARTAGGVIVSFDFAVPSGAGGVHAGYHLGGVRAGGDRWLWRASPSTSRRYSGPWPAEGAFDIGNSVGNAGGAVLVHGRHIFYGYRGENWKGGQRNDYRHYLDDGLLVAELGAGCCVGAGKESAAGMAGNASSAWLASLPDGRVFIYHNDEGWHGGLHRWLIDGLDTVREQVARVVWRAPSARGRPRSAAVDLLAGLPAESALPKDGSGWSLTPAPDADWFVRTNEKSWRRAAPVDLGARFSKEERGARASLTRELPAGPRPLRRWRVQAEVSFEDNAVNHGAAGGQYLELLDAQDRIIARFHTQLEGYPDDVRVYANGEELARGSLNEIQFALMGSWRPLRISVEGGQVRFQYAGLPSVTTWPLDPSADWRRPGRLRLTFWQESAHYPRTCYLDDLTFLGEP